MTSTRTQLLHALLAVAGATVLTLTCVWIMVALNRPAVANTETSQPIRCTLIRQPAQPAKNVTQRPHEPPPAPAAQQIMTVDLDAPPTTSLPIDPIEFIASLPSPPLDAIHVVVRKPVVSKNPPTATPRATPPRPTSDRDASDSPNETSESAIRSADQVDQPPREPAGNAKPAYPAREKQLAIEGTVVVKLLIDERGRVEDVRFVSGPQAFRQSVREAARSWRFEPARHRGRAVKVWGIKEVSFTHPRNRRQ